MRSRISYWPKRSGPEVETGCADSADRTPAGTGWSAAGLGAGFGARGFGRAEILRPDRVSEIILSISESVEKWVGPAGGMPGTPTEETGGVGRGAPRGPRIPERVSRNLFSTCSDRKS